MSLARPIRAVTAVPAWVLVMLIRGYRRFVSPLTPPTCRYHPSCSAYGEQAIGVHGALKGSVLTAWRVLRCHPWTPGGVDHVPPPGHWRTPVDAAPEAPTPGSSGAGVAPAGPVAADTLTPTPTPPTGA